MPCCTLEAGAAELTGWDVLEADGESLQSSEAILKLVGVSQEGVFPKSALRKLAVLFLSG